MRAASVTDQLSPDIVVVSAGTSGCYFAQHVSQAGFRSIVLQRQPLQDLCQDIDIFRMDEVRFDEFDLPLPTDDLISKHVTGLATTPDLEVQNEVPYAFYVLHKPAFHRHMHRCALEAGGQIFEWGAT